MVQSPQLRKAPTVSVIIAAYNAAPFLHRAVQSALDQSLQPLEVLIVDDASTDSTLKVASTFARRDPRVRIMRLHENGGPAVARNAGIDASRGDWIAILDADDAFMAERLDMLLTSEIVENADILADNFVFYSPQTGRVSRPALATEPAQHMIDRYEFAAHARPYTEEADWGLLKPLFRKSFLDRNHLRYPTFSRHGEDFLLMFQALLAGGRYALTRTPGYLYTGRSSGMSRTKIDYRTQIRHTLDLLSDPRVRTDARLANLLRIRGVALERLHNERKAQQLLELADGREIAKSILAEPKLAIALFHRGLKKAARHLRKI